MITDGDENCDCLAVKSLSKLLRGITSNHDGDFYYLNCFHSYRTKETLKKHEKVCKDHDYCYVKMPDKDRKVIKSSVYYLCRLRVFAQKNRHMSKS